MKDAHMLVIDWRGMRPPRAFNLGSAFNMIGGPFGVT